jgi:hypothetical protein
MTFDTSDLNKLEQDLGKIPGRLVPKQIAAVKASSASVESAWRSSATKSAGAHGKHYPKAVTHDVKVRPGLVEGIIGPDASKPQGKMSFELGSSKQPPHLDGFTAGRAEEPRFIQAVEKLTEDLL